MTTPAPARRYTPEDLLAMEDAVVFELVDGQLVERNVSTDASEVALLIAAELVPVVRDQRLGRVYDAELGVRAFPRDPDLVRRGDLAFVSIDRVPKQPTGYLEVVPDLVVEVISLHDVARRLRAKVDFWLASGVQMVWVANPEAREVTIYRNNASPSVLAGDDEIDGEDVIPGFSCPVARFFPEPAPAAPPPPPV